MDLPAPELVASVRRSGSRRIKGRYFPMVFGSEYEPIEDQVRRDPMAKPRKDSDAERRKKEQERTRRATGSSKRA